MADWSDLVYDVLEHITSFLSLPDHHRFSAVCKNWRFVAKQKRHSPATQLPWLVLGEDPETRKRKFYSLSEEKHYSIDIPELCGRYIGGSSHGWLFAIDIKITGILINPFTREFHELPQFPPFSHNVDVTTLIEEVPSDYTDGPRNYTFKEMQRFIVFKGILSHDPKVRSDFTAMILFGQMNTPAIWRPGDTTWTVIKGPGKAMKDVTYLNGNFYVMSAMNILYVVDLGLDPKMIAIEARIRPCICAHRYVVSFKGFLLLIVRFQNVIERGHYNTKDFMLLEIDLERKELHRWDDIDGCAIFLGVNSPIAIDASQFAGCKGNAFYFTDLAAPYSAKFGCCDLGVFDYVTKTITTYYPPEIFHPLVAPPVWLTPNPW
ncbi:F-box/kelch-repeat protein At1g57790-like [Carex rostrata]